MTPDGAARGVGREPDRVPWNPIGADDDPDRRPCRGCGAREGEDHMSWCDRPACGDGEVAA